MKFLDIKTDFAFKKVFGSIDSKDRLVSFLNSVIKFKDGILIEDLTIVDPYNIPLLKGMKDTYVDVKAVLSNQSTVIIEMQILNVASFEKRILYNAAKNYSLQLSDGEPYNLLNPIIALTIVDFVMFKEFDKYISNFKLIEKTEFIEYSGDIELIFIELPKFNKSLEELQNIQDQWVYFIKNAGSLNYLPTNIEPIVNSAFNISNQATLTQEELELQHRKKDFIYMQKSSLELAEKKGIEQGIEKGTINTKKEIAKSLLNLGVDINTIIQASGLSSNDINQLK